MSELGGWRFPVSQSSDEPCIQPIESSHLGAVFLAAEGFLEAMGSMRSWRPAMILRGPCPRRRPIAFRCRPLR
ncbi:hypothetical protein L575_2798 [Bordetella pertussis STO1-SEAT-0007]|nr:hypothetical protein L575_2798 [Bordetella pertussis STO1-SEAT-0007]